MLQEAQLPTDVAAIPSGDPLMGRWCRLRPLRETDYPYLYDAEVGTSWRLRGRAVDPQQYVEILHRNILTQLIVTPIDGDEPLGLVSAYSPDLQSGHCRLLMVALPGADTNAVRVMEGVTLLIRHLFTNWPFRKIYFETDQPGIEAMVSRVPSDILREEARLKGHTFQNGTHVDSVMYALYREQWDSVQHWFEPDVA